MIIIRPIRIEDLDQLMDLSAMAQAGLTTLPHDRAVLQRKIKESAHNFSEVKDKPGGEIYLFVAEDLGQKRVVGTTAIYSKVGGFEPFYTYKIRTVHKESDVLNVKVDIRYLDLIKDHDGPTEIGTLFLAPEYRKGGNGRLLSLSRFLFIGEYPQCFEDEVLAEMRGVIDEGDRSPFWEALGRYFFTVDFKNADMMVLRDKSFIADLMPEHPIYIPLLPFQAQDVIGKVHKNTEPALHLLKTEGFEYLDEIDIFEAGPVVRAKTPAIRSIADSRTAAVKTIVPGPIDSEICMLANVNSFTDFRVGMGQIKEEKGGICITEEVAAALNLQTGGRVRFVLLRPPPK